jgi:hypothetical protein
MQQPTMYKLIITLLAVWIITSQLHAQTDSLKLVAPIDVDRPDHSESATLVPKGYFQMENGFSIEDTDPGFLYTYPATLWKIGVSENFEFRVFTQYINIQHEPNPDVDGLLPIQVGLKAKLLDQKGIVPKAALLAHLSLPGIASKQFETTYFAPSFRLAFQHAIDRFTVSYNVGAEWNGESPRPFFIYTFSLGANIIERLGAFVEVYGDVPQQIEDDFRHRLDAGLTYLISDDVLADVSGGIGLSDNAPEKYVAIGLSYRFKM